MKTPQIKNSGEKLTTAFDLIFMPGSFYRTINPKRFESNILKGAGYLYSLAFEGIRLGIYGIFATAIPTISLAYLGIGLLSYIANPNKNFNHSQKNKNSLEALALT